MHLGPKDRERVAEGANFEQIVQEALGKVDAERPAWSREDLRREDPSAHANDARLLGDVPPHYGNGA
ncbi:MAG: transcriptional regulator [Actinomyces graevenitzii]|nr:transcriptional regulator [Actinomyces graevenitzii]